MSKKESAAGPGTDPARSMPAAPLTLAVSLAGHDRGRTYLVWEAAEDVLYLTDGNLRPLNRPKKKKCMHAQQIIHLPETVRSAAYCGSGDRWQDMDTRRVLKAWKQYTD